MSSSIQILPPSVVNQIAAGEVIQRPASVVKELIENSIDAGATQITIVLKEGGRSLIQVIDNGKGMSEQDAVLSFEPHATSKLKSATDLYQLHTFGFRGEALASIAAIAQVELRCRTASESLGVQIEIASSKIEGCNPISTPVGSNFQVKNLFYNVPARRKFLKSDSVELSAIEHEIERVALVHLDVAFVLYHHQAEILNLPIASCSRQRVVQLFGKALQNSLLSVDLETEVVKISALLGTPDSARKRLPFQYIFVNGRYIRHPYFHKAITKSYESIISSDHYPNYFLWLEVDPEALDVNIHPTKTEVKFEDESIIWPILSAAVKEALGKHNWVPSIDFNQEQAPSIPAFNGYSPLGFPEPSVNRNYNPFEQQGQPSSYKRNTSDWEKLYDKQEDHHTKVTDSDPTEARATTLHDMDQSLQGLPLSYFGMKSRYLMVERPNGWLVIHLRRAHIRILFEQYLHSLSDGKAVSQQVLFPETIEFSIAESTLFESIIPQLKSLGFDFEHQGGTAWNITGIPSAIMTSSSVEILMEILHEAVELGGSISQYLNETLALTLAQSAAIKWGQQLSASEQEAMINQLLACQDSQYTPNGHKITYLISEEELSKRFL